MEDFPKLETERLVLSQVVADDISNIAAYANNKNVTDNTRTMPFPYSEKDAVRWIGILDKSYKDKDQYAFAIRQKTDLKFIGGIGLTIELANNRAELGYWLAEPFWNRGFITEAVQAILKFGFEEINLNKIVAVYLTSNEASGKVMVKNGMLKEGEFKDHDVKKDHTIADGKYVSLIDLRLTHRHDAWAWILSRMLIPVASQEKLVQYSPSDIETPESLKNYVEIALNQKNNETSIPFIIFDKRTQEYAGSTRYMNISTKNKTLEIGSTWIGREFQGTGLNTQMKLLMLNHAFNDMDF